MSGTDRTSPTPRLDWSGDDSFVFGGVAFRIGVFTAAPSRPDRFVLGKPGWLLQEYLDLATEFSGARVVELGIAQGGSTAFFAELLRPAPLLALEIAEEPNAALAEFIAARGYGVSVRTEYGVDQGDRARVEECVRRHFGDEPLDLVIDDASHLLGPTIASFEVLFPRLRPGGVFVLEDWSHGHTWERVLRSDARFGADLETKLDAIPHSGRDLSRIVLALTLAVGYDPDAVADIRVRNGFAIVRRGAATLDPETFSLSDSYGHIGHRLLSPNEGNLS